jgi:cAMP-dependent protein kinase regulator
MGGKCFKEVNVANSIQISKDREREQSHNDNVHHIYISPKPKDCQPTSKKSNTTTKFGTLPNEIVTQRKTKTSRAVTVSKRQSLLNQNQEGESFKIIQEKNESLSDYEMISGCLAKHFFMRSLDKNSRTDIIKEMTLVYLPEDTVIFHQGDIGKYFYILQKGEVNLNVNGSNNKLLRVGDSFGELALLHQAPRSGTCVTIGECYFWILERRMFRKITEQINRLNFEENKRFISSIAILDLIEKDQKAILISNLLKEFYEEGDVIVKGIKYFNIRGR